MDAAGPVIPGLRVVVNPDLIVDGDPILAHGEHKWDKPYRGKFREMDLGGAPEVVKVAQGFLQASHLSFCRHQPLVLKPDHILITVMQSLALCILKEPQIYAAALGARDSVEKQKVTVGGANEDGSVDWNRSFDFFRIAIGVAFGTHVTDQSSCNFTTSCWATKNVSNITLMQIYSPFAEYKVSFMCGIPVVHLLGTEDDWKLLLTKVDRLSMVFRSLSWWFDELKPVVKELVELRCGAQPRREFWDSFYSYQNNSGCHEVTGHINAFFPYVHKHADWQGQHQEIERNHWFKNHRIGTSFKLFPHMKSTVDFIKEDKPTALPDLTVVPGVQHKMKAHAAMVQTMTVFGNGVMPCCSWSVTNASEQEVANGKEEDPTVAAEKAAQKAEQEAQRKAQQAAQHPVPMEESDGEGADFAAPSAPVEVQVMTTVTRVVLPCWHTIVYKQDELAAPNYQVPPICPECKGPVTQLAATY